MFLCPHTHTHTSGAEPSQRRAAGLRLMKLDRFPLPVLPVEPHSARTSWSYPVVRIIVILASVPRPASTRQRVDNLPAIAPLIGSDPAINLFNDLMMLRVLHQAGRSQRGSLIYRQQIIISIKKRRAVIKIKRWRVLGTRWSFWLLKGAGPINHFKEIDNVVAFPIRVFTRPSKNAITLLRISIALTHTATRTPLCVLDKCSRARRYL